MPSFLKRFSVSLIGITQSQYYIPIRGCKIAGRVTNFCRERKSICCQRACMFCCRSISNDTSLRISETQTNTTCIDVYDERTLNRDQTCIHLPCM